MFYLSMLGIHSRHDECKNPKRVETRSHGSAGHALLSGEVFDS